MIAENIAYQFASQGFTTDELAKRLMQGWIDSPGHRRNMLSELATEIGVGIAQSETTGAVYAVQLFGRPRSAVIAFSVENGTPESVEYTVGETRYTLPPRSRREHQVCEPPALELAPHDAGADSAIHPGHGDRYQVIKQDGRPAFVHAD